MQQQFNSNNNNIKSQTFSPDQLDFDVSFALTFNVVEHFFSHAKLRDKQRNELQNKQQQQQVATAMGYI